MGKRDTGTKERVAGTPSWHVAGGFLHNLKVKLSYQTFSIQKCTDLFGLTVCGEQKPSLMKSQIFLLLHLCKLQKGCKYSLYKKHLRKKKNLKF